MFFFENKIAIKTTKNVKLRTKVLKLLSYPWSGIDDIHEFAVWICFANGFEHFFIFLATSTEPTEWLAASTNGRLIRVQIGEHG